MNLLLASSVLQLQKVPTALVRARSAPSLHVGVYAGDEEPVTVEGIKQCLRALCRYANILHSQISGMTKVSLTLAIFRSPAWRGALESWFREEGSVFMTENCAPLPKGAKLCVEDDGRKRSRDKHDLDLIWDGQAFIANRRLNVDEDLDVSFAEYRVNESMLSRRLHKVRKQMRKLAHL